MSRSNKIPTRRRVRLFLAAALVGLVTAAVPSAPASATTAAAPATAEATTTTTTTSSTSTKTAGQKTVGSTSFSRKSATWS